MRKNRMMRLASALLILTMVTTCAISGTFAKYVTSDSATDTARVAKWGVEVTASGDTAFAEKYDDEASEDGTKVVSSVLTKVEGETTTAGESVLAPGTNGKLGGLEVKGQPEVMVTVVATADLKLTDWKIGEEEYCPLVFKVGEDEIKMTGEIDTIDELEKAVEAKFTALSATGNVAANTDLNRSVSVSWAWPFEAPTSNTYQTDAKDTALGNLATAPKIEFSCGVTVTQVD